MGIFDLFKGKPDIKKMKEKKDVKGLIKFLQHKNERVRRDAVIALVKIREPAVKPLIQALKIKPLQVLEEKDRIFIGLINVALGNIGKPAVKPLIIALKNENFGVRMNAAIILDLIGDKRAVKPLIIALKDKDFNVRQSAAGALGNIGDNRAVEPLSIVIKDEDEDFRVRKEAKLAVGRIMAKETGLL